MARVAKSEHKAKTDDVAKPGLHAPTTLLNIALPFSVIKTGEASKELAELADSAACWSPSRTSCRRTSGRSCTSGPEALRSQLD